MSNGNGGNVSRNQQPQPARAQGQPQGQPNASAPQAAQSLQENASNAQQLTEAASDVIDKAALIARLEQAEQALATAEKGRIEAEKRAEEADAARREAESLNGRRLSGEEKPLYIRGGVYKFRVGPLKPLPDFPHLVNKEVETVDESEAIRWYCANHEMKPGSNRQVDREKVNVVATCLENKRRGGIIALKNRLAALRNKVLGGAVLNADEEKLVKEFEAEVYGYTNFED